MVCTQRQVTRALRLKPLAASLIRSLNGDGVVVLTSKSSFTARQHDLSFRPFSTTRHASIKEFFPQPDTPNIKVTPAAWGHPVYSRDQMEAVAIAHRETKDWSDYVALTMVKILRWGLDTASGYKHDQAVALGKKDPAAATKKYAMTERKYLIRSVKDRSYFPRTVLTRPEISSSSLLRAYLAWSEGCCGICTV